MTPVSIVCCPSTFSKIFSSETAGFNLFELELNHTLLKIHIMKINFMNRQSYIGLSANGNFSMVTWMNSFRNMTEFRILADSVTPKILIRRDILVS